MTSSFQSNLYLQQRIMLFITIIIFFYFPTSYPALLHKRKDFTVCVLNTNSPYCILASVGSLCACCWTGKQICFFITFGHLQQSGIFCCSAYKLMLSGKNKTDLKDMFNSRYIYNEQIRAQKVLCTDFQSLVAELQKLTRSHAHWFVSKVLRLVNKNPYGALSMK